MIARIVIPCDGHPMTAFEQEEQDAFDAQAREEQQERQLEQWERERE